MHNFFFNKDPNVHLVTYLHSYYSNDVFILLQLHCTFSGFTRCKVWWKNFVICIILCKGYIYFTYVMFCEIEFFLPCKKKVCRNWSIIGTSWLNDMVEKWILANNKGNVREGIGLPKWNPPLLQFYKTWYIPWMKMSSSHGRWFCTWSNYSLYDGMNQLQFGISDMRKNKCVFAQIRTKSLFWNSYASALEIQNELVKNH